MNKIYILLLPLFFMFSFYVNAENCNKKDALKKANIIIESTNKQTVILEKIVAGEKVEGYVPQEVFGHDFEIAETDQKILDLKKVINEQKGIFIENTSLVDCLDKLDLKKSSEELKEATTKLINTKIALLLKNKKLRDSIRASGIAESSLPNIKEKINQDSKEAIQAKVTLEDSLIKIQSETTLETNSKKREATAYQSELTKIKIELLNLKIKINKNLENKITHFEKSTLELNSLSNKLDSKDSRELLNNFKKVESFWLSLSQENYYDLLNINGALELPNFPKPLEQMDFDDDISTIIKLRNDLLTLRKEIVKNYTEKKNQELKLLNHLVASSNSIRENYFNSLGSWFFLKKLFQSGSYVFIKNEIVSAPHRAISYFYSKFLFVREQIQLGREGYVVLFGKTLQFGMLIALIYGFRFLFNNVNKFGDRIFEAIFKTKKRSYYLKKAYSLWMRIKDNSVPLLWLLTLFAIQKMRLFVDLGLVIKVIEVYLASIILKSLVTLFLGRVSKIDTGNFADFKKKANETTSKFRNIFIFYFLTMIFIEATVGKVYLYSLINYFVLIYSLYHFFHETSRWENEFRKYSEKMFAGVIVERYFKLLEICPKKLVASFILVFILIFLTFDFIVGFTENFEISKKISANLFKKQVENIEAEEGADDKIDNDYKDSFSLKSLTFEDEYVPNTHGLEETINQEIDDWMNNRSEEHSLVVYGDKGIGKTTLLKKIAAGYTENEAVDVKYLKIPSKTITKKDMHRCINDIFCESPLDGDLNVYDCEKGLTKNTIVIIDECQNVFLSKTGGFDAYYELINIINLNTEKIFWIMSFNKYSWLYLDRAFGRSQFFRNVFELSGWSDSKIKELIMRRHRKTTFRLSYDLLISATRSQDEIDRYASIESKFFKLLWELSRGNPRAALHLWLSALSRKSKNVLNVNIPKEVEFEGIEKMPDELMFVISDVLKHENLSSKELEVTTNLQKGLVRNAIKLALEKKFLFKDKHNRYMVDISTQHGLVRFLKVKNFIYGK